MRLTGIATVGLVLGLALAVVAAAGCGGARGTGTEDPTSGALGHGVAAQGAPTMSSPVEYADRPISAEAGAQYFLHTGGGDPYATGLAYPVFLALMEAYPEELGRDWNEFAEKFGLIPDPAAKGDPKVPPVGFHLTTDPNTQVQWLVANCQFCHAERLRLPSGDVVVPGLGNKRVRAHAYAAALNRIATDPRLRYEVVNGDNARPAKRGEYVYEGDKPGYRVEGHPFLSSLPERDRRAVIEYLKTL